MFIKQCIFFALTCTFSLQNLNRHFPEARLSSTVGYSALFQLSDEHQQQCNHCSIYITFTVIQLKVPLYKPLLPLPCFVQVEVALLYTEHPKIYCPGCAFCLVHAAHQQTLTFFLYFPLSKQVTCH